MLPKLEKSPKRASHAVPARSNGEIAILQIYLWETVLLIESAEGGRKRVIIRFGLRRSNTLQIIVQGSFLGETENQNFYPMKIIPVKASGNRASLKWDIAGVCEGIFNLSSGILRYPGSSYQMVQMIHDNMTLILKIIR